jgi:hypothetical protein
MDWALNPFLNAVIVPPDLKAPAIRVLKSRPLLVPGY